MGTMNCSRFLNDHRWPLMAESCRILCHSTQPSKANRRVVVRVYNDSASKVSFELGA